MQKLIVFITILVFGLSLAACTGLQIERYSQQISPDRYVLARDLLDYNVFANDGKLFGEVNDMVLGTQSGQIRFVLVSGGGLLNIPGEFVPVPYQAFELRWDERTEAGQFRLLFEANAVEVAPKVDKGAWPINFASSDWDTALLSYWKPVLSYSGETVADTGRADTGLAFSESESSIDAVSIDTIIHSYLESEKGENLGVIVDMVVDTRSGFVNYIIVQSGDGLPSAHPYIPVPIEELAFGQTGNTFVIYQEQEVLSKAPAYDDMSVFSRKGKDWEQDLQSYWGSH